MRPRDPAVSASVDLRNRALALETEAERLLGPGRVSNSHWLEEAEGHIRAQEKMIRELLNEAKP